MDSAKLLPSVKIAGKAPFIQLLLEPGSSSDVYNMIWIDKHFLQMVTATS
jgi:hypothetical protein